MRKTTIILSTLILISCAAKNIDTDKINSLDYFEPVAFINLINKENTTTVNDSISQLVSHRLDSIVNEYSDRFRIRKRLEIRDPSLQKSFEKEVADLIFEKFINKNPKMNIPTPTIDSILQINNSRFTMLNVVTGFQRTKKNFRNQTLKSLGIGLLTLGSAIQIYSKNSITTYTLIFDSNGEKIVFENKTDLIESKPTKPSVLRSELIKTFRNYYF
ncbi:hypothetical protein [Maribacter litoralis]|uniref:Uncharacterized protein n=1 Tax=Maribacter litoralis TaxID=2059726 RepID=A0A653RLR8_9FLAO|nr:hypothetical protein [Maribacter litoralis]VXB55144.1 conserved hypothetical protein [Maribacter litoralis]